MPLLIANINLLTALGITNKEQFDAVFESFDDFDTFCHNSGYDYEFDDNDNLVIITPKSQKINTGIEIPQTPDYSKQYFTVTAVEDTTFSLWPFTDNRTQNVQKCYYSKNGTDWTEITEAGKIDIELNQKESLYIKALSNGWWTSIGYGWNKNDGGPFTSTGLVDISGNIKSLFVGDDFENENANFGTYGAYFLFRSFAKLRNAKDLIWAQNIPFIQETFSRCGDLISLPVFTQQIITKANYLKDLIKLSNNVTEIFLHAKQISGGSFAADWTGNASSGSPGGIVHVPVDSEISDEDYKIGANWTIVRDLIVN